MGYTSPIPISKSSPVRRASLALFRGAKEACPWTCTSQVGSRRVRSQDWLSISPSRPACPLRYPTPSPRSPRRVRGPSRLGRQSPSLARLCTSLARPITSPHSSDRGVCGPTTRGSPSIGNGCHPSPAKAAAVHGRVSSRPVRGWGGDRDGLPRRRARQAAERGLSCLACRCSRLRGRGTSSGPRLGSPVCRTSRMATGTPDCSSALAGMMFRRTPRPSTWRSRRAMIWKESGAWMLMPVLGRPPSARCRTHGWEGR
mmetsp:Transcript_27587/g.79378  ORF Transcript_27587/g.79378 Transcript_27587/m.79378 type:complete len:257 (+) Transcript_27587:873-1643(+)